MQALILAGGEGTRLRPLTSTVPKPVVPLVDRPFIAFMLEWLRGHGVDDVVISCGFLASGVRNVLGDGSALRDPAALRRGARAARHRRRRQVRRAAARRALPRAQRRRADRHRPDRPARAARARPALARRSRSCRSRTRRPTGWCARSADEQRARVRREAEPRPDRHEPSQRGRLRAASATCSTRCPTGQHVSIEREVFPTLVGDGLYGYRAGGYWLDIGTPERYLQATLRHPRRARCGPPSPTPTTRTISRSPADAQVLGSVAGPAYVGAGARVAAGAHVERPRRARPRRGRSARARTSTARSCSTAPSSAPHCTLTRLHRRPRRAHRRATAASASGVVLGEGVTLGADNQLAARRAAVPQVSLPDGAIKF